MAPDEIVNDGMLDCDSGPRIISLVLDVLSCMSLSLDQSSSFARKVVICVSDCLSLRVQIKMDRTASVQIMSEYEKGESAKPGTLWHGAIDGFRR